MCDPHGPYTYLNRIDEVEILDNTSLEQSIMLFGLFLWFRSYMRHSMYMIR